MNEDLSSLSNWFNNKANELSLNIKKTNYILFSKRHIAHNYNLSIDTIKIDEVKTIKFLGIYIERGMNWETHTNHVEKKLASGLFALNSVKHYLPYSNLLTLYYSIFHSHLRPGHSYRTSAYKGVTRGYERLRGATIP
jgi:hypothetical protein